jgi:hypothetical protein
MPGQERTGTVCGMRGADLARTRPPKPGLGLFLVEFSGAASGSGRAEDRHAAFQYAVLRMQAAGAPIRWCAGWLIPADQRCLCLVEAPDDAFVALACDTAALIATPIHRIRPLPRRYLPPSSLRTEGRS